jgi:hypothetical protein
VVRYAERFGATPHTRPVDAIARTRPDRCRSRFCARAVAHLTPYPRHVVPEPRQAYEPEAPVKVRKRISPALASPDLMLEAPTIALTGARPAVCQLLAGRGHRQRQSKRPAVAIEGSDPPPPASIRALPFRPARLGERARRLPADRAARQCGCSPAAAMCRVGSLACSGPAMDRLRIPRQYARQRDGAGRYDWTIGDRCWTVPRETPAPLATGWRGRKPSYRPRRPARAASALGQQETHALQQKPRGPFRLLAKLM